MSQIRKILVPVDFSPASRAALQYALFLRERLAASVLVLHAWELPAYLRPDLTVWAGDVSLSMGQHAKDQAEASMNKLLAEVGIMPGGPVTSRVVAGTPYVSIVEEAERGAHDLIVMGTRGRTGIAHFLVGSVAEKIVRTAPCPVITIREERAAKAASSVATTAPPH